MRSFPELTYWSVLGIFMMLVVSCDNSKQEAGPSEIERRSRQQIADRPGATIGPIVVQVLGPPIQGIPGRNGFRDPIKDVEVTFSFKSLPSTLGEQDGERTKGGDQEGTGDKPASSERSKEAALSSPPQFVMAPGTAISEDGLEAKVTTDEQGLAQIKVKLGMFVGDFRVQALIRNLYQQRLSVDFLVISGLRVIDDRSEGVPDTSLPVTLRLWRVVKVDTEPSSIQSTTSSSGNAGDEEDDDDEGEEDVVEESGWRAIPDADRRCVYSIVGGDARGATLEKQRDRTSNRGFSTVALRLGDKSGRYRVLAEIAPKGKRAPINRGILIEHYAINWWQFGLSLVGGLALFVIGLRVLASGLTIQLGQPLNSLAGAMAKNRFYGVVGGIGAGAAFSSSSAVVSHLASFANGGLLAAAEASGQILGANLGKTVLFQFVAFSSIATLAVPLIAAATLLHFLPNRLTLRPWANMLLGGGLLLLGWQFLGESAELGGLSPGFRNVLSAWDPELDELADRGFFRGLVVFGAVVFTSTAAGFLLRGANPVIAAAIAFVAGGMMSVTMVIAVISGASIGSALAAFVASLRKNRQARRLTFSQVLYQIGGGGWLFVATMIPVSGAPLIVRITDGLTPGRLFHTQPENITHHIAVLYTLVHLVNAVMFLGLDRWIQKLIVRLLPRDPVSDDLKPFRLDPAMVNVPSLALAQATREVFYLGELVRKAVAEAFDAFRYLDLNLTAQVARREESASAVQQSVLQHLLRVSENELSRGEAIRLQTLNAAAGGFNQISEIGDQFAHVTSRILEEKLEVPEDLLRELTGIHELMMNQFENVLHLLENYDPRVEENALKVSERVAKASSRLEALWFQRLRQADRSPDPEPHSPSGSVVVVLLTRQAFDSLVQVTAHLTNIVERLRILTTR